MEKEGKLREVEEGEELAEAEESQEPEGEQEGGKPGCYGSQILCSEDWIRCWWAKGGHRDIEY